MEHGRKEKSEIISYFTQLSMQGQGQCIPQEITISKFTNNAKDFAAQDKLFLIKNMNKKQCSYVVESSEKY